MLSNPQSLSLAVSFPGFFTVMRPFLQLIPVLDWGLCLSLSLSFCLWRTGLPKGIPN